MAARKTKTEDTKVTEQQAADSEAAKAAEQQAVDPEAAEQQPKQYMIICRNKITKRIGGVDFNDGVGYSFDGYAASWFAAKDGYTVERVKEEQL